MGPAFGPKHGAHFGIHFWPCTLLASSLCDLQLPAPRKEECVTCVPRVCHGCAAGLQGACASTAGAFFASRANDSPRTLRMRLQVFIDAIPKLGMAQRNEARRFITLVDTLYEEGTCLFAGCAVPLDRLFEDNNVAVDLLAGGEGSNEANDAVHIDGAGGSSGRSTTMIGEMEWSATGRAGAALAEYSASRDVSFAFERAKSRLTEMASSGYRAKRGVLA